MTISVPRLKALRRSHCDTCGCTRCLKLDALIIEAGEEVTIPDDEEHWLIEGHLSITDQGEIYLGEDRLRDLLARWQSHQVMILIGPHQVPDRLESDVC